MEHGLQTYWRKECRCEICTSANKEYYREYRKSRPEEMRARWKTYYNERRDFLSSLKAVPCKDCGVEYPFYVMDFDHKENKSFNIGHNMGRVSKERILEEVAKCDVVCANCHRERTFQSKAYLNRR